MNIILRHGVLIPIGEFGFDLFVGLDDVAGDGESAALQEPDKVVPDQGTHRVQSSL
jgi:hypothetical protein